MTTPLSRVYAIVDAEASRDPIEDGPLHHAIWTDLEELYRHFERQIMAQECELAHELVQLQRGQGGQDTETTRRLSQIQERVAAALSPESPLDASAERV